MTLHKAFENLTEPRNWYKDDNGKEVIPGATARSYKRHYKAGKLDDKTIRKILSLFGYVKVKEEEWTKSHI